MAQTYIVRASAVAFANNKHMFTAWNGSGSSRIVRITRIWMMNEQTGAVTGVITRLFIYKMTADGTNGTTLTPVKYDTNSENMPAQVIFRTNPSTGITYDTSTLYRSYCFSTDEYGVGDTTIDGVETFPSIMLVWDVGYGDSSVDFLTLREGEGITIFNTPGAAGTCNIAVEFTLSNT